VRGANSRIPSGMYPLSGVKCKYLVARDDASFGDRE